MNKQDLRDGDRLTLRNGQIKYNVYDILKNYNDDLTFKDEDYSQCDIVKVERIQFDEHKKPSVRSEQFSFNIKDGTYKKEEIVYVNSRLTYQTIWEREETPTEAEKLALRFHETYERLSPQYGYETREDTKEFDKNSKNGKLMIAVCNEIIEHINKEVIHNGKN